MIVAASFHFSSRSRVLLESLRCTDKEPLDQINCDHNGSIIFPFVAVKGHHWNTKRVDGATGLRTRSSSGDRIASTMTKECHNCSHNGLSTNKRALMYNSIVFPGLGFLLEFSSYNFMQLIFGSADV